MKLSEAKKSCRTVVIGVQESKGLLLEEEEDGVNQLEVLGEIVELVQRC
jgi:hypothetical protein